VNDVFDRFGSGANPAFVPIRSGVQSDEQASCPAACWEAVGTVQSPLIEWNCVPPFSSVPWL
jgi:hypothetical protein